MWISVLLFLGAAAAVAACLLTGLFGVLQQRRRLTLLAGATGAGVLGMYGLGLIGAGVASRQRELRPGEEKHICEIDCHIAYAVTRVARPQPDRFVVHVRMRFDETTTGPARGDAPLTPGPRRVVLQDDAGRRYQLLYTSGLTVPLRPAESRDVALTFKVPAEAHPTRLRLEQAAPMDRLLIGSETAPFHKRVVFRVG